jgi:hypothetical protein
MGGGIDRDARSRSPVGYLPLALAIVANVIVLYGFNVAFGPGDHCDQGIHATNTVAIGVALGLLLALPLGIVMLALRKVGLIVGVLGLIASVTPAVLVYVVLVTANKYASFECTA